MVEDAVRGKAVVGTCKHMEEVVRGKIVVETCRHMEVEVQERGEV